MKTLIAALTVLVSITAFADDPAPANAPTDVPAAAPVVEKGKLVMAKTPGYNPWLGFVPFGAVGGAIAGAASASSSSSSPSPPRLICTYKGPSGQKWDETPAKGPCHGYSTHEVQPTAP